MTDTRVNLDRGIDHWSGLERNLEQFQQWIRETEMRVSADAELKTDLAEKKAYLDKMRVSTVYIILLIT